MIDFKKLNKGRIIFVSVTALTAMIIIAAISRKSDADIREIKTEIKPLLNGRNLISEREIQSTLFKGFGSDLRGTNLNSLEIQRAEEILKSEPFVADANVYLDAGNRLHIYIEQREPMVRIIDETNKQYYLDATGQQMPMSHYFTARVLVTTGKIPAFDADFKEKNSSVVKDIYEIATKIKANEFMLAMTEQIFVNDGGDYVIIPNLGTHKINLGKNEDIDDKFERLKIFLKEGLPYEGWNKYEVISLKYKGQVIGKKR
jgi:cell division protein FtsQ